MENDPNNQKSGLVTVFHGRRLPEPARPTGYAALVDDHDLPVPLQRTLSGIGLKHRVIEADGWRILTPRHAPGGTLGDQLRFALKHEGIDLAILKALFGVVSPESIVAIVRKTPTGGYARRIWFLYEWLTGERLDLPDASSGSFVPVVDPNRQVGTDGKHARRYRVRDNLPGTPEFCPMVFRTEKLDQPAARSRAERAKEAVGRVPREILARAAAFLLLSDSKASYAIEGERAPHDRIQRWGRAIGEAGRHPLTTDELVRLQEIVIGDKRFVRIGMRNEGGFVGEHNRETHIPLPDHISARAEDLPSLVSGMVEFANGAANEIDPVVAAAILSFGFVYVHPFEDGNGRIHRYLIHHILAQRGLHPPGMVFPVSSAILDRIGDYRAVLESYSRQLLPLIRWKPTPKGNLQVENDTADLYRYFDATPHAEFLCECVERTIEVDLPREVSFLQQYDRFRATVETIVDMPERTFDLLFRFLGQNAGRLSSRAKDKEFAALTEDEVEKIEESYGGVFGGSGG